jgi:hypothetical protein
VGDAPFAGILAPLWSAQQRTVQSSLQLLRMFCVEVP